MAGTKTSSPGEPGAGGCRAEGLPGSCLTVPKPLPYWQRGNDMLSDPQKCSHKHRKLLPPSPEAVRQNNGSGTSLAPVLCPVLRCPSYSSAVGSAIWGTQGQMVTEEKWRDLESNSASRARQDFHFTFFFWYVWSQKSPGNGICPFSPREANSKWQSQFTDHWESHKHI